MDITLAIAYSLYLEVYIDIMEHSYIMHILKLMSKILKGWAAAGFVPNAILHMV